MTVIYLNGNLSEGFIAFGPYENFDAACDAHDFEQGWIMTLNEAATPDDDNKEN